ncbi:hypothetical protein DFR30_0271 [Thiogranum longum]|uniref:Uncharacterized protein n=1 Tax=Thiogranum longum TaxID=1537524 RepID=A0A4R1H965_9GAMM|nr:hypothetical protein [Thiogranum longum]TCK17051.1 hypothetical protein DFR30_0271 [Thiogranum longum]
MKHIKLLVYILLFCTSSTLQAEETLDLDGMSIIGNRELPKALFIVPWKDPEAALAPDRPVNSLINNSLQPVDPDVFRRKLQYFDTVHKNGSRYTAETP